MPAITVNVAVLEGSRVLLTKRDDFEVWCLPSGGVEDGESVAQAAVRETREETGLEVELESLVGIYSRLGALPDTHAVLFTARPVGGTLQIQPGETIDVRYFPLDEIPDDLSLGHRQRIKDAIEGIGGSVAITQEMILPAGQGITSQDIVEARKLPRKSRKAFYKRTIGQAFIRTKTDVEER